MLMLEGDKIAEEREQRDKECPRLVVDWDEGTVSTNGKQLISCGYENDAVRIVEFVNNFRLFSGDVEGYQTDAWKIMVWYFATPLLLSSSARMRSSATGGPSYIASHVYVFVWER